MSFLLHSELLCQNTGLTVSILDALSNLNLRPDLLAEVSHTCINRLIWGEEFSFQVNGHHKTKTKYYSIWLDCKKAEPHDSVCDAAHMYSERHFTDYNQCWFCKIPNLMERWLWNERKWFWKSVLIVFSFIKWDTQNLIDLRPVFLNNYRCECQLYRCCPLLKWMIYQW